ncbi:NADAR family protein [Billgrantia desiderata]|uniref:NADAR family protein n=1 Tax=Billgrantia desiderata TaxID=52021 RepID=UPI001F19D8C4|nr:NADAR family protein [Halomonas desiderata]MCE8012879.1 NADAR family protein [Halomonas desiderata]
MNAIREFSGAYRWLSNFAPAEVKWDGVTYLTVEHAYQAAKFQEPAVRRKVGEAPNPGGAKLRARLWPITTPNWDTAKVAVMEELLTQKFDHPDFARQLLGTGDAYLEEGNHWGDVFWGVCKGEGENWLGRLLMEQRARLGGTGVVADPDLDFALDDLDMDLGTTSETDDFDLSLGDDLGPWYLHHPESSCAWIETDPVKAREALEDGLVMQVDRDDYEMLQALYADDFDLEMDL